MTRLLGILLGLGFATLTAYAWIASGRAQPAEAVAGDVVVARRWRARAVIAAALSFLILGTAAWWARPRLFGRAVEPGADVIAVLPFTTSGPSVALLGEGLMDLLSTNLNQVGGIRTVDPRTTLHNWRRIARNGTDLNGSLRVGRAVNAGSVLLGSVVEIGGRVRLSAQLLSVDGDELGSAQADARPDSVLQLVDRVSVDLLRSVWRSRQPIPDLRLSAITTTSPAALRAYLSGEQLYRRSQYDSARVVLEQAVAADSTFALAHFRLSEVYGWMEVLGSESARHYSAAAERFAERLPARERALVVAHRLHEDGESAAPDSLRAFVERFPDDAVGWHLLADAQYHARDVRRSNSHVRCCTFKNRRRGREHSNTCSCFSLTIGRSRYFWRPWPRKPSNMQANGTRLRAAMHTSSPCLRAVTPQSSRGSRKSGGVWPGCAPNSRQIHHEYPEWRQHHE